MSKSESFNQSSFSKFLNSPAGRIFRLVAGSGFVFVGYIYRDQTLGLFSIVWGLLAISAVAFDLCFISAVLGGPISGTKIRTNNK